MTTALELSALILIGGLLELDRMAVFHGLICEPIVAGPIAGLIVGDPVTGLKVGIVLQLYFMGSVSVGGACPPDGTLTAIVAAGASGIAHKLSQSDGEQWWVVAVLLFAAPMSRIGAQIDRAIKNMNVSQAKKLDLANGDRSALTSILFETLGRSYLIWCATCAATLIVGVALLLASDKLLPPPAIEVMSSLSRFLPLIAAGFALSSLRNRRRNSWFVAGCAGMVLIIYVIDAGGFR